MEATSESVLSPLDPFPQLKAMRMLPERLLRNDATGGIGHKKSEDDPWR